LGIGCLIERIEKGFGEFFLVKGHKRKKWGFGFGKERICK
jgi:hypothetical protein